MERYLFLDAIYGNAFVDPYLVSLQYSPLRNSLKRWRMRTDLMISIIVCIGSAVLVKFLSFKLIPDNISSFKKVFAGIFSWIFFLGTVAWMILFGDTLAEWLISPEDGLSLSILISSVVFLSVYFLSFRSNAPYPATEFLIFALYSRGL